MRSIVELDSPLQTAALRISFVFSPAFAAVDVEAPQTEWALKMLVSMPAFHRTALTHLAMVEEATGHSQGFARKNGKKNSATFFDCLDCFAKPVGVKVTPLGLYLLLSSLSPTRSADLEGCVSASNMAVLWVKSLTDNSLLSPRTSKKLVTLDTSQVEVYLG